MLTACDNKTNSTLVSKPTIASMIASGNEKLTTECIKGDISLNCEFLSGDLLGTHKWHHAKFYLSNNGDAEMIIDNENFDRSDVRRGFYEGRNVTVFQFEGADGSRSEITIITSNNGSDINMDAWNKVGKKFMIGSTLGG